MRETREQLEHELDLALAAELQSALLPDRRCLGSTRPFAAARNRMCGSVGGDFYDFIRLNDDQYVIVIGDVVGHGIRAALLMAQIMGYLHSDFPHRTQPIRVVRELNRWLINLGERIGTVVPCSLFYSVLDVPSRMLLSCNAGHPRAFVCDRDTCSVLQWGTESFLLGIEEFEPEESCMTFESSSRMVLYTDGVTDATGLDRERFGESRLHEVLNAHADDSPDACAEAVFAAVSEHRNGADQDDDETILIIDSMDS
ncbi:MAG: PP2C family protein-serine/threonine phosphatase [Phycisphaerae bacterium]